VGEYSLLGSRTKMLLVAFFVAAMVVVGMTIAIFMMPSSASAAKETTFEKGVCSVKAGKGGGGGETKELHHGNCDSNGADL
jgi:NADH:ubiquinone oxidoreductase subunit 3 (subunit A)